MNKKLEIGWMFAFCMVLWLTEQMTGWFSAHFPSWFFQTVWGVALFVFFIIQAGQIFFIFLSGLNEGTVWP